MTTPTFARMHSRVHDLAAMSCLSEGRVHARHIRGHALRALGCHARAPRQQHLAAPLRIHAGHVGVASRSPCKLCACSAAML